MPAPEKAAKKKSNQAPERLEKAAKPEQIGRLTQR